MVPPCDAHHVFCKHARHKVHTGQACSGASVNLTPHPSQGGPEMPTGPGDVLQLIRHGRARTRGEILDVTGLSRMTVSQRLDALLDAGLVLEGPTGGATGG